MKRNLPSFSLFDLKYKELDDAGVLNGFQVLGAFVVSGGFQGSKATKEAQVTVDDVARFGKSLQNTHTHTHTG